MDPRHLRCPKNRLLKVAVSNKQAAICGMPVVSAEDAEMIVQTILSMRGLSKKSHVESWRAGELHLKPKKLPMQGKVQAWRKVSGVGVIWHEAEPYYQDLNPNKLSHIACPECGKMHETRQMKLRAAVGFSNISCRGCRKVSSSSLWQCRCQHPWHVSTPLAQMPFACPPSFNA